MDIGETVEFEDREGWRAWLEGQHQVKAEIWLVITKRDRTQRLGMRAAQEEALCYGWVDSALKPIDGGHYALRFSPRRKISEWGKANRKRALRMLQAGKIAPAGLATLPPDLLQSWRDSSHEGRSETIP